MKNKYNMSIIVLLVFIAGLILGYLFANNKLYPGYMMNSSHIDQGLYDYSPVENKNEIEFSIEQEDEYTYDDLVANDGELQHMMDEMMLIGRGKEGQAYEEAWLRGMIAHHLGAIEMSKTLLEHTKRPELQELANNTINNQSTEISQMKAWLGDWYNND
ncbi:MAG: DUF305 domain-containing protein [Patescibacteria group bacterium]